MNATVEEENEVEPGWSKAATAAAALFGVLATTLGTFATATGGLERLFRDERWWTLIAMAVLTLGLVVALGGPAIRPGRKPGSRRWRNACFAAASVLFVFSLYFGTTAAVKSASVWQGPSITGAIVSTASGQVLEAQVDGSGLRSELGVRVEVHALLGEAGSKGAKDELLYAITTGADSSGALSIPFKPSVPAGRFDRLLAKAWVLGSPAPQCTSQASSREGTGNGCLLLALASRQSLPQVKLNVANKAVTVILKGGRSTDAGPIRLRLVGSAGKGRPVLFDTMIAPGPDGSFDFTSTIALAGTRVTSICASAGEGAAALPCTGSHAWAQMLIPASHTR